MASAVCCSERSFVIAEYRTRHAVVGSLLELIPEAIAFLNIWGFGGCFRCECALLAG